MPTVGSLFAGIGGFDLGLERAGFTVVGQVELDPFCARVLATRWPGVARSADVRALAHPQRDGRCGSVDATGAGERPDGRAAERDRGPHVDLLCGGFPCQDLSVAGKRAGLGGERSGLFWEIVRIAKEVQPPWGLFENVPGLVSSHRGRDLETVLAGLRECWPVVGYRILDSRYFGVAQRRRRIFFVGGPTEAGVAQVLALTEGGAGDSPPGGEAGADVARCLATGTNAARWDGETETFVTALRHLGSGGPDDNEAQGGHLIAHTLTAPQDGGRTDRIPIVAAPLSAGSHDQSHMPGRRREDDENLVIAATLKQRGRGATDEVMDNLQIVAPVGGGNDGTEDDPNLIVHPLTGEGHDASEDGTGRGTPLIAFSTTGGSRGDGTTHDMTGALRVDNPTGIAGSTVRRLTPVECERLQGFPDGWTCLCQPLAAYAADPDAAALACTCPDSPRYRALGNAVTVNVIHWLGRRLMAALDAGARGS